MKELVTKTGQEIASSIPGVRVEDDPHTLRTYSKDLWPRNLLLDRDRTEPPSPSIDAVVWPENPTQVSEVLKAANGRGWEIYPYGAGSGVCGGATPGERETMVRPRVVLDLKRMDRLEFLDPVSMVAKIQAGMVGQILEEDLNQKGFTMGHFPSSIYCSTFGGYMATRAAGQLSTLYGKIEDMILAIEGVLPSGEIFRTPLAPKMAVGPDFNQLLLGSEGTLAVLTAGWAKVHPLPETRRFLSYKVASTEIALNGVRAWMQRGLRPAVTRIYDEDESQLLHNISDGVKLIVVVEGETELADFTARAVDSLAKSFQGFESTGEEPAQHWWSHRYDISYYQQILLSHRRVILDTFEVSATWASLPALHRAVRAVSQKFKKDGMLILLAHFSHFYHTGGNIYFTLCGRGPEEVNAAQFYDIVWEELLQACAAEGAAISHHHGIGRLKTRMMRKVQGPLHDLLKKFKHDLDPKNILNAENLGL